MSASPLHPRGESGTSPVQQELWTGTIRPLGQEGYLSMKVKELVDARIKGKQGGDVFKV